MFPRTLNYLIVLPRLFVGIPQVLTPIVSSADIAEVFSISGEFIKISNEPNPDAATACWKVQEGQDQKKYEIS
ncbi:hypothetical protein [Paraglaciecola psychrophila]|jgi:hypothetical protein|uniref:Uncharacterized protein n=1 Tax=Paraglaciecola psychrophila 170 TaxID=1129794 RepID=K7AGX1_9ALTE|nr:hypothetical protein [Paraglaciecola psychrophila]AGH46796.1 hypothetical protein C427_4697 [Paraglaciecola psychrophila 170]GAC39848.1 hypothetical protein GPSY_4237 [Paraglaciecola psychrophila 170]